MAENDNEMGNVPQVPEEVPAGRESLSVGEKAGIGAGLVLAGYGAFKLGQFVVGKVKEGIDKAKESKAKEKAEELVNEAGEKVRTVVSRKKSKTNEPTETEE